MALLGFRSPEQQINSDLNFSTMVTLQEQPPFALFRRQYTNFSRESNVTLVHTSIGSPCLLVRPPWWASILEMASKFVEKFGVWPFN